MTGLRGRHRMRVEGLVEFAPSVGWLSMMALPLLYQYPALHPSARNLQVGLALMVSLSMLVADFVCYRMGKIRGLALPGNGAARGTVLVGFCCLIPMAAHLYLMPHFPLLALLMNDDTSRQTLMQMRDDSAKFLAVPSLVKYSFNWALFIFAPLFIAVSFYVGRCIQALAGIGFAGFYAAVTLAKLPLVLLTLGCWFALCVLPTRGQRVLTWAIAGSVCAGLLMTGVLLLSGSMDELKIDPGRAAPPALALMKEDDPRRALTPGDYFRLSPQSDAAPDSRAMRTAQYIVYRVWLTPSDVSNRWYQYFSYVTDERLGLRFLLPGPRTATTETPSRLVGLWAYQSRFPDRYTRTISANASFDADAFAHAGVFGVVLATVLLLVARIGAAWLLTPAAVAMAAYGVMLGFLTVLPASASLQAIFGANGLALVPLLLLAYRMMVPVARRANQPQRRI